MNTFKTTSSKFGPPKTHCTLRVRRFLSIQAGELLGGRGDHGAASSMPASTMARMKQRRTSITEEIAESGSARNAIHRNSSARSAKRENQIGVVFCVDDKTPERKLARLAINCRTSDNCSHGLFIKTKIV